MGLIQAVVQNPVKVVVGLLLLGLFGFVAISRMPMQLTPEVQIPTVTIETRWPGASPQEIEREIIQEQELQLKSVEGVQKMSSESSDSQGTITLEFAVGTNMNEALLTVNTRLQQVRDYPVDADEPVIRTANLSDRPIAWFILSPRGATQEEIKAFQKEYPALAPELEPLLVDSFGVSEYRLRKLYEKHAGQEYPATAMHLMASFGSTSTLHAIAPLPGVPALQLKKLLPPDVDVTRMRKFAEDVIKARFERVSGVANSNVFGGREEEMQVIVDPRRLAARRLTIEDVRQVLVGENKDTSSGDMWEGKRRYVVRVLSQFREISDIENTVLANQDGSPVYVKDVARVELGYKKPSGLVRRFGTERLAVNCIRENGANVLDVMDGLRKATQELNEGILGQKGLMLSQVYDETEYIYSAVGLVETNIIVGGLLTVAVLLLFLRSGRSTLVIGIAIPSSIIGTFLLLFLMGRSLNVISLAGLAFAVGMLVDNAVVVLENIYRHRQMGKPAFQAAVRGTTEVWGAVLASTLTTLAVFVPILFVEEQAGQLFRDIALAISCGIALSLLVSMTFIPMATARLLKKDRAESPGENGSLPRRAWLASLLRPFDAIGQGFTSGLVRMNGYLQKSLLLRAAVVGGFVGGAVLLSWLLMPKVEYLPAGNRNLVFAILLPPPGYNLDHMLDIGTKIETNLAPYWDVDPEDPKAKELDYPPIGDYFFVARGRNLFMGLRAADPLKAPELIPLVRKVTSEVPGTFAIVRQSSLFEQGLTAGRNIDIEIVGPDLPTLVRIGGQVLGKIKGRPGQEGILPEAQAAPRPSLDLSSPEIHIRPRREQARQLGMSGAEIGYTVNALVDGAYVGDYIVGGNKIDLRIIGDEDVVQRTQEIEWLEIATRSGQMVPLKAIARVGLDSGPEQVNHRERQRAITIQVTPSESMPLEEAMERIQTQIVEPLRRSEEMRSGEYQINLSGTADKLDETWRALRLNFLFALAITYLLMAALFESWLYPLVIIISVPLGAVGGFAGLALLNVFVLQKLDVLTMLGFVILIGTVVNNPILIVQQSLVHMRQEGMAPRDAILASIRSRARPIFMTTTTTVFGLLPLVLFPGAGSELYRGLGAVILGGLVVSTLVTLLVVPTMFSLALDLKAMLMGTEQERAEEKEAFVESARKPVRSTQITRRDSLHSQAREPE